MLGPLHVLWRGSSTPAQGAGACVPWWHDRQRNSPGRGRTGGTAGTGSEDPPEEIVDRQSIACCVVPVWQGDTIGFDLSRVIPSVSYVPGWQQLACRQWSTRRAQEAPCPPRPSTPPPSQAALPRLEDRTPLRDRSQSSQT